MYTLTYSIYILAYTLEELVDVYLLEEFLEKEPIRIKIDEVRRKLEGSAIHKSKQHRLNILLDDIAQNRHRVQTMRMANTDGEEAFTLKQLGREREELLSEEQHLKLADALLEEEFNSSRLVYFIKDTKNGLKFISRRLADLTKHLQLWLEELVDTGKPDVRNKVAGLLEELPRHKGISHERYIIIKKGNNIL